MHNAFNATDATFPWTPEEIAGGQLDLLRKASAHGLPLHQLVAELTISETGALTIDVRKKGALVADYLAADLRQVVDRLLRLRVPKGAVACIAITDTGTYEVSTIPLTARTKARGQRR